MCLSSDQSNTKNFTLPYGENTIHVRCYGRGEKLMIGLHGYDYDASVFASWAGALGQGYTLCVPDLPFHGESVWHARYFTPLDITEIVKAIAIHTGHTTYTLVGHSMGARLLVCGTQAWEPGVEQYVLLAPAGIGAFDRVLPRWVQDIVEWTLQWPQWLGFLVSVGHRMGWVSNFRKRYYEVQLVPNHKRFRLFRVFNSLTLLRTGHPAVRDYWDKTTIPTLVLLAQTDRFVPNAAIKAYFDTNKNIQQQTINSTHDLVHERSAQAVASWLYPLRTDLGMF